MKIYDDERYYYSCLWLNKMQKNDKMVSERNHFDFL